MSEGTEIVRTTGALFSRVDFKVEADLEESIIKLSRELFGPDRIYVDTKKKISASHGKGSIPDGYLVDLSGHRPRLYVVENELASHDPLRHIAVQLLQFSMAFDDSRNAVQRIVHETLQFQQQLDLIEDYAEKSGFRNIDHVLHTAIHDEPFRVLVIIDQIPDGLERSLTEKFKFSVDILELARYANPDNEVCYRFTPFLAEVAPTPTRSSEPTAKKYEVGDIDTVVVPAHEDGFQETFLGEDRWYQIRIGGTMRSQIKYIAAYRTAPVSAITHIAEVASIEPWQDTNKYVLNFVSPATEIGPIKYVSKGRVKHLQNMRYTTRADLENAKTLDDVW
ncbi:MAG: hypothetical protein IH944_02835 [Armatimonadetes bacterium]|nr:hypothetical protein [Armatimonadota bacterium]